MPDPTPFPLRPLLEKVAFAALMAILTAGLTTWAEVRSLRHELDQLRLDLREVQKDNKEIWANLGYTWTDMQRRDPKALSKPDEGEGERVKPKLPPRFDPGSLSIPALLSEEGGSVLASTPKE